MARRVAHLVARRVELNRKGSAMKLNKVIVPTLMAGALALTLGACGSSNSSKGADAGSSGGESKKAESAPSSTVAVTIDGVQMGSDYQGSPCAIVNYTFTNVSDEDAQSFMVACREEVYQNGVQCETAMCRDIDSSANMTKVKAGNSVQVQKAYKLQDSSNLEVNVYPLISFDKKPLATQTFALS